MRRRCFRTGPFCNFLLALVRSPLAKIRGNFLDVVVEPTGDFLPRLFNLLDNLISDCLLLHQFFWGAHDWRLYPFRTTDLLYWFSHRSIGNVRAIPCEEVLNSFSRRNSDVEGIDSCLFRKR